MSTPFKGPTGVFSAALTPLTADLMPDHAEFAAHAKWLLAEGCDGIAMLGTTGEANSFSAEERMALLEATVAAGVAPDRLLPGTGVAAFTETVTLTKHALSCGVTTVVMLPPFYYKGVSDDGVFAAYSEILNRIGDSRLRVVLYHIPQMSAVPISHAVIERLIAAFPETVVASRIPQATSPTWKRWSKNSPASRCWRVPTRQCCRCAARAARAASPQPPTSWRATSPSCSATRWMRR